MSRENPESYKIKAICLNCNNINELEIPYGVDTIGKHGIYLSRQESKTYEYYNLDKKEYQSTAFYPKCEKCGSTSLKKTMHMENEVAELEKLIDKCYDKLRKIKLAI